MRSSFTGIGFVAITLALAAACGPPRQNFLDSGSETAVDTGTDIVDAMDATDVEAGGCDSLQCNDQCMTDGYALGGACRATDMTCQCFGERDAMDEDAVVEDVAPPTDAPRESGVRTCTTNAECPASTFCSGAGCDTPGFCYPRGEADPSTCGTEGPPSCGCDGTWYPNTCARLSSGVRLNPTSGACGPVPTDAGP